MNRTRSRNKAANKQAKKQASKFRFLFWILFIFANAANLALFFISAYLTYLGINGNNTTFYWSVISFALASGVAIVYTMRSIYSQFPFNKWLTSMGLWIVWGLFFLISFTSNTSQMANILGTTRFYENELTAKLSFVRAHNTKISKLGQELPPEVSNLRNAFNAKIAELRAQTLDPARPGFGKRSNELYNELTSDEFAGKVTEIAKPPRRATTAQLTDYLDRIESLLREQFEARKIKPILIKENVNVKQNLIRDYIAANEKLVTEDTSLLQNRNRSTLYLEAVNDKTPPDSTSLQKTPYDRALVTAIKNVVSEINKQIDGLKNEGYNLDEQQLTFDNQNIGDFLFFIQKVYNLITEDDPAHKNELNQIWGYLFIGVIIDTFPFALSWVGKLAYNMLHAKPETPPQPEPEVTRPMPTTWGGSNQGPSGNGGYHDPNIGPRGPNGGPGQGPYYGPNGPQPMNPHMGQAPNSPFGPQGGMNGPHAGGMNGPQVGGMHGPQAGGNYMGGNGGYNQMGTGPHGQY